MEQISLGSDWSSTEDLDLRQCATNGKLEQRHRHIPGEQRIDILDGRFVRVRRKRRGKPLDGVIHLGLVDPEPVFDFHTPWRFIAGATVSLLVAIGLAVLVLQGVAPSAGWSWGLSAVGLIAALACAVTAWHRYKRRLIFLSQNGRAPLFKIIRNHPDQAEYNTFMAVLRQSIDQGHFVLPDDRQSILAEEMREHRRLYEIGFINGHAYEDAKAILLKLH